MSRQAPYELTCGACGRSHDHAKPQRLCQSCHRPLLAVYDLDPGFGQTFLNSIRKRPRSMWRFREVLPVSHPDSIVSLREGGTPLIPTGRLAKRIGVRHLWIKDEAQNPTGSFKARGMSAAISRARELGLRKFCVPSAGNAAGAAAAYCALAGCELRAYMPADSGDGFFEECRAYGADVIAVDGTIADCGVRMRDECDPDKWFDLSTLKEPYRLEGKKTMGYELFEDFDGALPDVIVYPTGGGTGLIGMWKAFDEMQRLGWIDDRRPRMVSVQAEGCAPIVRAFESGAEYADKIAGPQTSALGLRVPSAVGDFLILRAIRRSNGLAISVSESEWAAGQSWLASDVGLFPSPEGGAALYGLFNALSRRLIDPSGRIVVFNTGSGFKYPSSTWPRPMKS